MASWFKEKTASRAGKIVLAAFVIFLVVGVVYAVTIVGNILHIGPIHVGQSGIIISQVSAPSSPNYAPEGNPSDLLSLMPSNQSALGQSYKFAIRIQAPSGTTTVVYAYLNVSYSGTAALTTGSVTLLYWNPNTASWSQLMPAFDPAHNLWEFPLPPFTGPLPAGYDSTLTFVVSYQVQGQYDMYAWTASQ